MNVFDGKVGLHQGSVLSPLFAVVMDVVSSEVGNGLPSELMFANDLLLMAPTTLVVLYVLSEVYSGLVNDVLGIKPVCSLMRCPSIIGTT